MAQGRSTKIISMIKWIRTSRLSIKNSLYQAGPDALGGGRVPHALRPLGPSAMQGGQIVSDTRVYEPHIRAPRPIASTGNGITCFAVWGLGFGVTLKTRVE